VYNTNGYTELTPAMEKELADYCAHDVYLCEQIFTRLAKLAILPVNSGSST
jgi:hypothetical protein